MRLSDYKGKPIHADETGNEVIYVLLSERGAYFHCNGFFKNGLGVKGDNIVVDGDNWIRDLRYMCRKGSRRDLFRPQPCGYSNEYIASIASGLLSPVSKDLYSSLKSTIEKAYPYYTFVFTRLPKAFSDMVKNDIPF